MAPPKTAKDGFAAAAGALRKAIQELLAPELKQHTELPRQHGGTLADVLSVLREQNHALHEQNEISREHSQSLIGLRGEMVELRGELRSFQDRVIDVFNKLDGRLARMEDKLDVREWLVAIEARLTTLESCQPR